MSDGIRQDGYRPDGKPDETEIDGRLALLEKSYASVSDAHNGLEDRVGRLLTGVAFLTAAILALVALGSGNYATRRYLLAPFNVPLALAVVVVFLVTVAFAVILLLSAMSGPLGLPIIAGQDVKARFSSQGNPKSRPGYIYESSQLDYEGIADLDPEEWRQKWSGVDAERPQRKPQSLHDLKLRREASLIGDVHNLAVKTSFKRDRNTEAVSMLLYALLAFAAAVFVVVLAAYKSDKPDPVTLRFWARLALGVIFGAYFWLELALPGRLEQQSITLESEERGANGRTSKTTGEADAKEASYQPPGKSIRRSRVCFSTAVFLLVVSMLTFLHGWPWWATTIAFVVEGILIVAGFWAFFKMQKAMYRSDYHDGSRSSVMGTPHEILIQHALLVLGVVTAVGGIVSEIKGWYFGQFMAVWVASLVLLVAALLRPTFSLWGKRADRESRAGDTKAPAGSTAVGSTPSVEVAVGDAKPGLDDIEECFVAVLEGRLSRRGADRWAKYWLFDETLAWGQLESWGLNKLSDIDLRHAPAGAHLYDQEQVRAWLRELRDRRMK